MLGFLKRSLNATPAEQVRRNIWSIESAYEGSTAPTMLSLGELKMLEWLARSIDLSDGSMIVDAGSFLGGSTCALAAGLKQNGTAANKAGLIHAYDMFLVPNDHYSRGLIGDRVVGTSVLDIFERHLGADRPLVTPHVGDFKTAEPLAAAIALLFLDICKAWPLNQVAVSRFFPDMIPGKTIVIQQDHNDHSCAWVNVTMEFFAEYFDYLTDDGGSRVYLYTKRIPDHLLATDLRSLPVDEKIRLATAAAKRSRHPSTEWLCMVSVAWMIAERDASEAVAYLRALPPQPWESEQPYVEMVAQAVEYQDRRGHDNYIKDYFTPSAA